MVQLARFAAGESYDTLDKKVEKWKSRDQFKEFYRALTVEAERKQISSLPPSLLNEKEEECFDRIWKADLADKEESSRIDSAKEHIRGTDDVMKILADVLGTKAILELTDVANTALDTISRKEEEFRHPDNWSYEVEMPGLILATNSNNVTGNTLAWKFRPDQVRVGSVIMSATSRITNVWTFVLTGAFALGVVLLMVFRWVSNR